jgi:hypothetical protein
MRRGCISAAATMGAEVDGDDRSPPVSEKLPRTIVVSLVGVEWIYACLIDADGDEVHMPQEKA